MTSSLQKRKQQSRANGVFRALEDPSGCDMEAGCGATGRKERDPGGWCSLSSQGPVAGGRNAGLTGVQTHSSLLGMDRGPAHSWLLMKARSRWKPPKVLTGQSEAERVLIACDQSRAAAVAQPHSALPFAGDGSPGTAPGPSRDHSFCRRCLGEALATAVQIWCQPAIAGRGCGQGQEGSEGRFWPGLT